MMSSTTIQPSDKLRRKSQSQLFVSGIAWLYPTVGFWLQHFNIWKLRYAKAVKKKIVQNCRMSGWDSNVAPLDDFPMCLLPPFDLNPTWPSAKETYGGGIPLILWGQSCISIPPGSSILPIVYLMYCSVVRHYTLYTYNCWVTHACAF